MALLEALINHYNDLNKQYCYERFYGSQTKADEIYVQMQHMKEQIIEHRSMMNER